jgi:hypothetical protein
MRLPLDRFFAVWLLAQIILPFTAPFPVCDIADVFGGRPSRDAAPAPISSGTSQAEAYAYAPPLATAVGRLKLVVVTVVDSSAAATQVPPMVVRRLVEMPRGRTLPRAQTVVLRV